MGLSRLLNLPFCQIKRKFPDRFEEPAFCPLSLKFSFKPLSFTDSVEIYALSLVYQIWDTAGQESFRSITRNFYQGSDGVFLVFDITQRSSFEDIQNQWLREIRDHTSPSIVIYLIGNFSDMEEAREVPHEEALAFARDQQFSHYIETSAKTG